MSTAGRRGLGRRAFLVASLATTSAWGRARVPVGGTLSFRIPWALGRLDPHDLFDPVAVIFASAVVDTLYTRDPAGRVKPALADGMPFVEEGQTIVKLRAGLQTGRGLALSGRDVAWSVARARKRGAGPLFSQLTPFVRSDPERPLIARFGEADPQRLALLLCSPLTAVVPVGFSPVQPDGTGPFVASLSRGRMSLARNPRAARGPAFLERITVSRAASLADSLRHFEAGHDDLGWLGLGFHQDRASARRFDYGNAGWLVLATGRHGGSSVGTAQQLADHVAAGALGVGLRPGGPSGGAPWTGPAASLLYDGAHPHLREIASAVAASLSRGGAKVTPRPVSRGILRTTRARGSFALALDVVRSFDLPGTAGLALTAAHDREAGLATGKKKSWPSGARSVCRGLEVGVLAGFPLLGGAAPGILVAPQRHGRGIEWGGCYRAG